MTNGQALGQAEYADGALKLSIDGQVGTVTLARPERRNALTPAVWHGLAAIGADLIGPDRVGTGLTSTGPTGTAPTSTDLSPEVRVVVVRGEGPSFCAGIDLNLLAGASDDGARGDAIARPGDSDFNEQVASYQAGYLWLRDSSIVSIAAVQGHAIGAGFQLALACDLRILSQDAKLCMKEPALGLVPDLTGTKPLVDIVGLPRAIELCLTARTVTAAEALLLRLAELVVPGDELDAAVADLVAALLTTDAAAARATKALLDQAPRNTLPQQAAAERRAQLELLRRRVAT